MLWEEAILVGFCTTCAFVWLWGCILQEVVQTYHYVISRINAKSFLLKSGKNKFHVSYNWSQSFTKNPDLFRNTSKGFTLQSSRQRSQNRHQYLFAHAHLRHFANHADIQRMHPNSWNRASCQELWQLASAAILINGFIFCLLILVKRPKCETPKRGIPASLISHRRWCSHRLELFFASKRWMESIAAWIGIRNMLSESAFFAACLLKPYKFDGPCESWFVGGIIYNICSRNWVRSDVIAVVQQIGHSPPLGNALQNGELVVGDY